jgi:hypothetical protein
MMTAKIIILAPGEDNEKYFDFLKSNTEVGKCFSKSTMNTKYMLYPPRVVIRLGIQETENVKAMLIFGLPIIVNWK